MSGDQAGAFSELMDLQLLSGADYEPFEGAIGTVPSDQSEDDSETFDDSDRENMGMNEDYEHPDQVAEYMQNGGNFARYEFEAVDQYQKCHHNSNCYGWSVNGSYTVATSATGSSLIMVDTTVRAPYNLEEDANIFFAGFGIAYGPWSDRTEAFIALNNIDVLDFGYSFDSKSIKSLRSLEELKNDPMDAYLESQSDVSVWHPIEFGFNENKMRLHGFRHFEKTNDDRDFKLGTVRQWTVGFYDYHTGAGAWSDDMELVLESGFDVATLEEV